MILINTLLAISFFVLGFALCYFTVTDMLRDQYEIDNNRHQERQLPFDDDYKYNK